MPTDEGTCSKCYYSTDTLVNGVDEIRCKRYPPDNRYMRSDNLKLKESVTIVYRLVHKSDWCGEYLSRKEMK